jgi:hypothetical protein
MFSARASLFGLAVGLCCLLAGGRESASAAQADIASDPRLLYECEAKAAEYTKNLGKSGDKQLYQDHLKLCLEVSGPGPVAQAKVLPRSKASSCAAGLRPMTFKNNTSETIWVGAWDSNKSMGVVPPSDWPNWELPPNASKIWCAPNDFDGRFTARARCNVATGKCLEGDCCSGASCEQMICTTTSDPASLAEINFDVGATKLAWYDTSYVDGYNFLVTFAPSTATCPTVGTGTLPDCPWVTVNGVCLAPYRQYAVDNPWYAFEPDYYVLAAMCAQPGVCGCGNQCPDIPADPKKNKPFVKGLPACPDTFSTQHPGKKQNVTLASSGCSPIAKYSDPRAQAQVVCDPLKADYADDCKHPWPQDYKVYVQNLHQAQPSSYSWQYKDKESLATCALSDDLAFTVTFGPRPANPKGNVNVVQFSPAGGLTGTIKAGAAGPVVFVGPTDMKLPVADGATVVVDRDCGPDTHLSCSATYSRAAGFTPTGGVCADPFQSGIKWTASKELLALGAPAPGVCVPKDESKAIFTIYAGGDVKAFLKVNEGAEKTFSGPDPYAFDLKDKDGVSLRILCDGNKSLTCTGHFSMATKLLTLDAGQPNCVSSPADWGKTPLALHPGKPAANLCK